ncbi:hypothetical protein HLB44_09680 [Aquincola sp. S2]|uniref:Uncharacterized protein n=1 Tax=Pseudaquabacterium terrae TaxID=2732868 RepID=A0ABX2EF62_9BURK|nr:DUF6683 family protein [Aquabacterium terrae]NRF67252.1 hypothetical protein [Aquabacterium terrae]
MNRPTPPDLTQRLREAIATSLRALHAVGVSEAPLTVPRAASPLAPGQLAATHPGPARERLELAALYQRCLRHYRSVVRSGDTAAADDDVGAALAHFVAANLHALHGTESPPEALPALSHQLVAIVRGSPAWQRAPLRERQAYAEQLAILSVLMTDLAARARRDGAAAMAHVKQGAANYLRQLLGLDPHALTLDVSGLTLRDTALAA